MADKSEWERIWDARIAALTPLLGKPADSVYHAATPMYLGGYADVLPFPDYAPGMTYVTADLTGEDVGQIPSSLGNYELMVCAREELPRAADMISLLARYTCEARLEPGETMDLPDFFPGSVIRALLFAHPGTKPVQFRFLGQSYGLLLCIGITAEELAFKHANGSVALLELLTGQDIFPYTILQRESVTS
jgi:suppressor of fused protein SUFU